MSIRKIVSLVAAVAFTAVSAAPARCHRYACRRPADEPERRAVLGDRATNLSKGAITAGCTATFNGTITSTGIVNITSTTFTGGATCSLISGSASSTSPWTGQADSTTQLSINNVKVNVTLLGTCGPSKVMTWSDTNSSLAFNNSVLTPDCTVAGTVLTSPKFHVQ